MFQSNYTADVRYVGSRGIHLNVQSLLNFVPGVTAATAVPTYIQAPSQSTLNSLTNAWATCDPTSVATQNGLAVCQGLNLADVGTGCGACGDSANTLHSATTIRAFLRAEAMIRRGSMPASPVP